MTDQGQSPDMHTYVVGQYTTGDEVLRTNSLVEAQYAVDLLGRTHDGRTQYAIYAQAEWPWPKPATSTPPLRGPTPTGRIQVNDILFMKLVPTPLHQHNPDWGREDRAILGDTGGGH